VMQGQQLATAFSDMSARFDTARRAADAKIQGGLDDINSLTAELADINAAIAAGQVDNAALQDRQATVLDSLSAIANVNLIRRGDGGVDVALANGEALVLGPESYTLAAIPTGPDGLSTIQLGDTDVTASITGGRLGGLLQVRDTIVPGYQTRLDELAYAVVTEVNVRHQAGFTANGAPAGVFFTPLGGVADAAELMTIDPALAADPSLVAASGTGTAGDNGAATALANLRSTGVLNGGTTSMLDAWGQLVYTVGADSQMALMQQGTRQSIVEQVTRLRDSVEGVSLDEEAAMLIKYQRAYEANAQFFSVVDQTLQTLLNLVGGR
jgi:flagellar hook-associated protein 1